MKIKNILISQPKPSARRTKYDEIGEKYNLNIDYKPFITVESVSSKELRKQKVDFSSIDVVILTSRTAADHFFKMVETLRVDLPKNLRYYCLSESIAFYLTKYMTYRKRKIFYVNGKVQELLPYFKKHGTKKVLLPVSDIHKKEIPNFLKKHNIEFQKMVLYRTVATDLKDVDINKYDVILFFSPSGIKSLQKNFPDFKQGPNTYIGAFGPTTKRAVKTAGFRLDIAAPTQQAKSMAEALELFIKGKMEKV